MSYSVHFKNKKRERERKSNKQTKKQKQQTNKQTNKQKLKKKQQQKSLHAKTPLQTDARDARNHVVMPAGQMPTGIRNIHLE